MKFMLIFSVLVAYCQAGIVPASTTLLRQSTSIAHPAFAYSAPVALSYSAPVYTHYTPTVYSLAPAHYTTQFYGHHFVPQQPIYAQYPSVGVVVQNPQQIPEQPQYPTVGVVAQNPQYPQQILQEQPVQDSSPVIEPADEGAQQPQNPPQSSEGSSHVDDDTVSVEAA